LENEVMKTKTVTRTAEEDTIKSTTLDVDTTDTENTSDSKLGILTPTLESMQAMTPYQKVLRQEKQTETNNKPCNNS
jgi:hypothetical protein